MVNPGSPPRGRPSRRLDAAARREAILRAALPEFARGGFAATGTRDLARAAGVSEPILYRHFAGKEALFAAVLERAVARILEALAASLEPRGRAAARLRAIALALPDLLGACSDEIRLLASAAAARESPEAQAAARQGLGTIGRALAEAFRRSGLRRGVDATTAGFLLLELGIGAAIVRPLGLPETTRATFGDAAIRLLLSGVGA